MEEEVVADEKVLVFEKQRIAKYFKMCLRSLPNPYTVYFATLGLDIIDDPLDTKSRSDVIDYIYSLQVSFLSDKSLECTFTGQSEISRSSCACANSPTMGSYIQGHIAMTYCSVLTLHVLGDDFSRLQKTSVIAGLKLLQQPSGAFQATREKGECDMRFLYCACAISATLDDWTGVDMIRAEAYILDCITYEGGLSLVPGNEAHGGSTYTAVASLALMGRLDALKTEQRADLLRWCLMRQSHGYNGRTNKDNDSCYSFWIGATLDLLGEFSTSHIASTRSFLLGQCQHGLLGGFAKMPGAPPDILHSFYSLCWLAMAKEEGTARIDCRLQGMRKDKSTRILNCV